MHSLLRNVNTEIDIANKIVKVHEWVGVETPAHLHVPTFYKETSYSVSLLGHFQVSGNNFIPELKKITSSTQTTKHAHGNMVQNPIASKVVKTSMQRLHHCENIVCTSTYRAYSPITTKPILPAASAASYC